MKSELLASCYRRSLDLARDAGARSIAFPAISTGVYGYPKDAAAAIAAEAVAGWLRDAPAALTSVLFVGFDIPATALLQRGIDAVRPPR